MDQEAFKECVDYWGLKGLGLAVGFVFEVFFIRTYAVKVKWTVSLLSILAMGLMGWISFDIATAALPESSWKPTVWSVGATANTWIIARMVVSGKIFSVAARMLLPERIQGMFTMEARNDERQKKTD